MEKLFTSISLGGTGWIVAIAGAVLRYLGYEVDDGAITEIVGSLVIFVGAVMAFVGQLRREDLEYGILRK